MLERISKSRLARVALATFLAVAGLSLGFGWQDASTAATSTAVEVASVCDTGGPAGAELAARGSCDYARRVVDDPARAGRASAGNSAASVCPLGTSLEPVMFADGKSGLGCVRE